MNSLKASRRSETAGRPKCRSETCTRVVTKNDSTRTRPYDKRRSRGIKASGYGSPAPGEARLCDTRARTTGCWVRVSAVLLDVLQEIAQGGVELLGGFEV